MLGLLNPWVILGLVLAFAGVGIKGYWMGQDAARAEWAVATMKETTLAEKVRGEIRTEGQKISSGLEEKVGQIKVENKTIVRNIRKETEVHHVLTDVNCAYPPTTVRVVNDARAGGVRKPSGGGEDAPRPAAGKPLTVVPGAGAVARR